MKLNGAIKITPKTTTAKLKHALDDKKTHNNRYFTNHEESPVDYDSLLSKHKIAASAYDIDEANRTSYLNFLHYHGSKGKDNIQKLLNVADKETRMNTREAENEVNELKANAKQNGSKFDGYHLIPQLDAADHLRRQMLWVDPKANLEPGTSFGLLSPKAKINSDVMNITNHVQGNKYLESVLPKYQSEHDNKNFLRRLFSSRPNQIDDLMGKLSPEDDAAWESKLEHHVFATANPHLKNQEAVRKFYGNRDTKSMKVY